MIPASQSVAVVPSGVGLISLAPEVRCVWTLGDLKSLSQGPRRSRIAS